MPLFAPRLLGGAAKHPYSPADAVLPHGYAPARVPFTVVLAVFFGATAAVCVGMWRFATTRGLARREAAIVTWLTVSGVIHLLVEGYVVTTPAFAADTTGNFLAEIWKEYAKADSRYATRDAFTICMEAVTAFFVGPLCLAAAGGYVAAEPWRHVAALVASVCQLYGDALYFATCAWDGWVHARGEALYFWFYFVAINSVWVVLPAALAVHAAVELSGGGKAATRGRAAAASPGPKRRGGSSRRR